MSISGGVSLSPNKDGRHQVILLENGIVQLVCEFYSITQAIDFLDRKSSTRPVNFTKETDKEYPISRKQANELTSRVSGLPSKMLRNEVQTKIVMCIWAIMNNDAQHLARCLEARLRKKDGDPIQELLTEGELDELTYHLTWFQVEEYDILLNLIQLSWNPLRKAFSCFACPPDSGFHLLLKIIIEQIDEEFASVLDDEIYTSPANQEALMGGLAKIFYRNVSTTKRERKAIDKRATLNTYWLPMTLQICKEYAEKTNNNIVEAKIDDYFRAKGRYCDYLQKYWMKERKSCSPPSTLVEQKLFLRI